MLTTSLRKTVNGVTTLENTYPATDKVDEALAWLDGVTGPWMLYLSFNLPHVPFHEPPAELHTALISLADALKASASTRNVGMDRTASGALSSAATDSVHAMMSTIGIAL